MQELIPTPYPCPSCGKTNETLVDPGGGSRQVYTEDCTVCCRPNVLRVTISGDGEVSLDVESEA
jgi:hypothetical protein